MIRHVVLINVKADTPAEATLKLVEGVRQLPSEIPVIRQWEVGLGLNPTGATVGVVGVFDDLDAFAQYMSHPAHKHCAQTYILPIMDSATQVQFEVADGGRRDVS